MLNFIQATVSGDPRSENAKAYDIPEGKVVPVEYISNDVPIPQDFLSVTSPPVDAEPITLAPIDWTKTVLPEYEGRYAVVLDNVVSPSECQEFIKLAESSVDMSRVAEGIQNPWRPAMVAAGSGYEVLDSKYRNSDRIVWDQQEVVDRLWMRCLQGDVGRTLLEKLEVLDNDEKVVGITRKGRDWKVEDQRWEMRRLNKRMRFLKYGPGQFFRPHCDSHYTENTDGKVLKTFFTLHLYLNDSVAEAGKNADLVGGATSFVSSDAKRKINVDPKAGRVLVFQHRGLYHAGDDVVKGTKYTMRAEIMYEKILS
ncbi:hypothetical protein N0V93_000754 [Gnomoniopsis smithogilvyi]|uniref:Prolyl 4-hydroxylase alpha subunit domain-containing protein n=1 Tax=Gnomoniopsis smithogilvyi TaxID=1191159 RepID=A0A9W8Z0S0_9PEZI|nr:hypothetical protein N0V93_000754 [Gnomoniopsis smithogilvyi]